MINFSKVLECGLEKGSAHRRYSYLKAPSSKIADQYKIAKWPCHNAEMV